MFDSRLRGSLKMEIQWPLSTNLTIYNRTATINHASVAVNLKLVVNLTCSGVLFAILIVTGLILFIRYRQKTRNTSNRDKPDGLPEIEDAPRVDSFRNKRQRDQEFPYINYGIKYFLESSSDDAEEIKEVIYDVPRARGKKRPCPFDEDFQCARCNVRKFLRGSYDLSSIMSVFDSMDLNGIAMPCDASSWSETSRRTENEDIIMDVKCDENYDTCDIIFQMPQVYDGTSLSFSTYQSTKFEMDQSPNVVKSPEKTRLFFRGYATRSRTRRYMCSLENMNRTWSFQSLLRQWHQYCREAMEQVNQ